MGISRIVQARSGVTYTRRHIISARSFAITDEHNDIKAGRKLLEPLKNRIMRIFGDKGYGSKVIYNTFGSVQIIPLRRNASSQSSG